MPTCSIMKLAATLPQPEASMTPLLRASAIAKPPRKPLPPPIGVC